MKWLPLIALLIGGLVLLARGEGGTIAGLETGEFAYVIVFGTLLAFIGASAIAGYRGRLWHALRDILAWGAIAIGLVGIYTYRAEVTELAHRITGELMPPGEIQIVDVKSSSDKSDKAVRIRRRPDGHFIAKVQVNGATATMLVDTGASTVVLRAPDARQMGLDIDRLSYTVPVQTANGLAYAAAVRLRQVAIGPIVIESVDALVARPGALKESLLGMSFLRRLRSYEFSGDFLTLRS